MTPATRTPISWTPPADMKFEAWQDEFAKLMVAQASLPWLLGDCLNAGELAFGQDYTQALPVTRKAESLKVYMWVAAKVSPVTRVTDLHWSHHRAVAKLEPSEQARWLERAREGDWSSRALMDALKPAVTGPAGEGDGETTEPEAEILPPVASPEPRITFSPQGGKGPWRDAVLTLWRAGEEEWQREMIEELRLDIPAVLQRSA